MRPECRQTDKRQNRIQLLTHPRKQAAIPRRNLLELVTTVGYFGGEEAYSAQARMTVKSCI
jgi:hypothetical protein